MLCGIRAYTHTQQVREGRTRKGKGGMAHWGYRGARVCAKPAGVGAGGDGHRDRALCPGLNHRFCLRMCVCVGGGER